MTEETLEQKADRFLVEDMAAREEIKKLLSSYTQQSKEIEVSGTKIKVLPTIPKAIRKELAKFSKMDAEENLDAMEQQMYLVLSKVCLEDPWNKPEAWEYIDEKTGVVPELIREIFNQAYEVDKKIKNFR